VARFAQQVQLPSPVLTKLTFEPGGFGDAGNVEEEYQVPEHRNQRLEHGVNVHLTGVLVVFLWRG
jgi:hypothetical protein